MLKLDIFVLLLLIDVFKLLKLILSNLEEISD